MTTEPWREAFEKHWDRTGAASTLDAAARTVASVDFQAGYRAALEEPALREVLEAANQVVVVTRRDGDPFHHVEELADALAAYREREGKT